jgi:16S rRNA processing protein RimM
MKDKICIGKIIGVHGIKGEIKVKPLTDEPDRYYDLENIYINKNEHTTEYIIEKVRMHKHNILLLLKEVKDRNIAELLINGDIYINENERIELKENEYFVTDLIGSSVYEKDDFKLGEIIDVIETGAVDVISIKGAKKDYLIPFQKQYFSEIDINNNKIVVNIPEDLKSL